MTRGLGKSISRQEFFSQYPDARYSDEELLRAGEMLSGLNDEAFDVARAVFFRAGASWEDATQAAQAHFGQKVQPRVARPTVQDQQYARSMPLSSPVNPKPTSQDVYLAGLERQLGSARLNRLVRGEREMNQRINAELAIRELQLEGMAEPILKELQAQGTPVTKETKVRLIQRLGEMLGKDFEKQVSRANTGIQNYVKDQGALRLAGQALLASGLGLGVYEYMDPEEVVEDPAATRQYQGSLN